MNELEPLIEQLWDKRDSLDPDTDMEVRQLVGWAVGMLDTGHARIAEQVDGEWRVNQ